MKLCPLCNSTYPEGIENCPEDGAVLRQRQLALAPGDRLRGKYEVLAEVGAGGMASVYKVRHLVFHDLAAVKVVHARYLEDAEFVKRFRNEAIVARRLKHPNAVRIDDLDFTDDGRPFIVMEYVEGTTLLRLRQEHPGAWPLAQAVSVVSQIAQALDAAHALKIVHRDIKPSNVLITEGDHGQILVKVVDFGIAKVSGQHFDGMTEVATRHDTLVGTPEYMSPEQAQVGLNTLIDARSDLYSLGLILYELLAGTHPFKADSYMQMLMHQVSTPPPPPEVAMPNVPPAISAVVHKALRKSPSERFQTAREFLDALHAAQATVAPQPPAPETQPAQAQGTATPPADLHRAEADASHSPAGAAPIAPGVRNETPVPVNYASGKKGSSNRIPLLAMAALVLALVCGGAFGLLRWKNTPTGPHASGVSGSSQRGTSGEATGSEAQGPTRRDQAVDLGDPPVTSGSRDTGGIEAKNSGSSRTLGPKVPPDDRTTGPFPDTVSGKLPKHDEPLVQSVQKTPDSVYRQALDALQHQNYATAFALSKDACGIGSGPACGQLGWMYEFGKGTPVNASQAAQEYRTGCDHNFSRACARLGRLYAIGSGVAEDDATALALFRQSCTAGDAMGCSNLGTAYRLGRGTAPDPQRAAELEQKGCSGGDSRACFNLGTQYQDGHGVPRDDGRAVALYEQSCGQGEPLACGHLGVMYASGRGVSKDEARAVALYRRACDTGDPGGCSRLGFMTVEGRGVVADPAQAVSLFRKGCDGDDPMGCFDLGVSYERGKGIEQNPAKARELYEKACNRNQPQACLNLGLMYAEARGVPQSFASANTLFSKGCDGGNAQSCWQLGLAYDNGKGLAANKQQASQLYRRSCDLGYQLACERMKAASLPR